MTADTLPQTATVFRDVHARKAGRIPLSRLLDTIEAGKPHRAAKDDCPLFSAFTFGDQRTAKGSLRSTKNALHAWAVVAEHDAGTIAPELARDKLAAFGVAATLYTTASHTREAPRWRIVAPTGRELDKAEYPQMVARINGLFGGAIARESFTVAQSFYFGRVNGRDFAAYHTAGAHIDELAELDDGARYPEGVAIGDAPSTATDTAHRETVRTGADGVHHALLALAARWIARGVAPDDVTAALGALLDACEWKDRAPERWRERRDSLARIVISARDKFSDKREREPAEGEDEPRPPEEPQNLFDSQTPRALELRAALPSVLADFAAVRAGVAGHDPTAYAYAAIAAASGVIPHATRIELAPTWREPLLQWVAEVGPTGSGKSPAMNAAVEPVIALHNAVQETYKRDLAAWKATKSEGDAPGRSGYYFTDPSIEALIDRAANASHTILRHADEGTAWLNAMGRYSTRGDSGERGIWLAGWNGSAYTVTRIERGDKSLDAWGVAVLYGITPGKLKEAYADASSDGMLARTLICLTDTARWIPAQADPNAASVTERYAQAVKAAASAERTLTLSAPAADRWQALRTDYRETAQAVAEIAPGLSGFLVKAPTMAARLAGLFALLEGAAIATDGSMERAAVFMRHAATTARIAHEQVFAVSQPVAIARRLAARILTSGGFRITRREFMRTDAFAKATEPERGAAIEHLAAAGWLLEADGLRVRLGPRFREATGWRVNPLVYERFADIAEREREAARDALARMNRLLGAPHVAP